MARITVEDCERIRPNRFELVVAAARRARELSLGAAASLPTDGDKPTVMALREIAAETVACGELLEALVHDLRQIGPIPAEPEVGPAGDRFGPESRIEMTAQPLDYVGHEKRIRRRTFLSAE